MSVQIRELKDNEGNVFYPLTDVHAIGVNGAPAFDEKPTKNSDGIVRSGGVFDEITTNGSAFDVTVYNSGHTYTSLSEALNAVPTDYKKGGMSIKYVQTSDNKYIRYNLLATSFTTDVTQWAIDDAGVYVENPEFVYVKTDKEDKILWAIKTDGSIYYGAGVPQQVIDYINEKIADLSLDEYEDVVAFLSGYLGGDSTLKSIIDNIDNTKVDKVTGKSLIDAEFAKGVSQTENPEFAEVHTDADDKLLYGVKQDGGFYFGAGIPSQIQERLDDLADIAENKVDKEEGKSLIDAEYASSQSATENPEFMEVELDADDKVVSSRDSDGVLNEKIGINTPRITVDGVDLLEEFERVDVNDENSVWNNGEVSIGTGELTSNNKRIRCENIKKHELSITATGGYAFSVYIYNSNIYIGCLNESGAVSKENIKWLKSIDLTSISKSHPQYVFNIVACRVDSTGTPINDVMTPAEGSNIKMLTPFEMQLFIKDTFCPIVSFIDDDFIFDAKDNWYNICAATGIRMGFAVPTASMNESDWKAIRRLQSAGFDFLSHTHNHVNLMNDTADVIRADLQASIDAFNNNGVKVSGLVYPQSSISLASLDIVKQYFEYSFNGGVGLSSIQGNPVRQHNITRTDTSGNSTDYTDPDDGITYHVTRMAPLATLKSYVDKAVNENCWLIFESHFRNSYKTGDGFIFTPEMLQEAIKLIEYAISKGCKVVTPSEGYQILKNRLMRGIYGSNNYYIVDHNGFIYRKNM